MDRCAIFLKCVRLNGSATTIKPGRPINSDKNNGQDDKLYVTRIVRVGVASCTCWRHMPGAAWLHGLCHQWWVSMHRLRLASASICKRYCDSCMYNLSLRGERDKDACLYWRLQQPDRETETERLQSQIIETGSSVCTALSLKLVNIAPGVVRVLLAYRVHQKAREHYVHNLTHTHTHTGYDATVTFCVWVAFSIFFRVGVISVGLKLLQTLFHITWSST